MKQRNWAIEKYHIAIVLLIGLLFSMNSIVMAGAPDATTIENNMHTMNVMNNLTAISIIPQDGFNIEIIDNINDHYIITKLSSPAHNWFAGEFTQLPIDKEVTLGLSMDGNDTSGNKADVTKWSGLKPMMTYSDPSKYDTYEWYNKDDNGQWESGDPLKIGKDKYAGIGNTPKQSSIPLNLACQFLSADGKYWQAWREVNRTEIVPLLNIFRIKMKFALPTATNAMRVPFTYTYEQQFIDKLLQMLIILMLLGLSMI